MTVNVSLSKVSQSSETSTLSSLTMIKNLHKLGTRTKFLQEGEAHLLLISVTHPQDLCRALLLHYTFVFTQQS